MKDDQTYLVIPENEINKLENARVLLWDLAEKFGLNAFQMSEMESVTSTMYKITNRKWEKV